MLTRHGEVDSKFCTLIFNHFLQANLTEVEDGSVKVGEGSGISHSTIGEYNGLFRWQCHFLHVLHFCTRDIIAAHMLSCYADKKIGGPGLTVKIDESMFGEYQIVNVSGVAGSAGSSMVWIF